MADKKISELVEETVVAFDDEIAIHDKSAGTTEKMTRSNFIGSADIFMGSGLGIKWSITGTGIFGGAASILLNAQNGMFLVVDNETKLVTVTGGFFSGGLINSTGVHLKQTKKLVLNDDNGDTTYIHEVSDDYAQIVVGDAIGLSLQEGATDATEVNVVPGALNVIANDATDGFLYIPETATGAPTGTPTAYAGKAAMCFDPANKKLYVYNTDVSAWESTTLS